VAGHVRSIKTTRLFTAAEATQLKPPSA